MNLERIGNWLKEHVKWIGIGVSLLLILVLTILLVDNKQELNRKKELETELEEQTVPYLKEISDIQGDIVAKKKELEEKGRSSAVSTAFVVSSVKDAEKVKELTEAISMPVSILLNDSMELQEVEEVLSVLDAQGYEMILTGSRLMDGGWEKVDETGRLLKEAGYHKQPAFLLLMTEDKRENLEELEERGYTTILRYRKELDSGKTEGEQDFFPYSIIKEKGVTEERINQLVKKSANMFFLFHIGAIEEELMTEQELRDAIGVLREEEAKKNLRIVDLPGMSTALQEQMKTKGALQQEFEAYEAERNKKIEELERAIDEIYAD